MNTLEFLMLMFFTKKINGGLINKNRPFFTKTKSSDAVKGAKAPAPTQVVKKQCGDR